MISKLRSTSGESIAETMVAVLISSLALLMLAGTINSASRLITKGQDKMVEYYDANNALAEQSGTEKTEVSVTGSAGSVGISESWSNQPYYKVSSTFGDKKLITFG